jgi:hypothetical protein
MGQGGLQAHTEEVKKTYSMVGGKEEAGKAGDRLDGCVCGLGFGLIGVCVGMGVWSWV